MATITEETVCDKLDEAMPLLLKHWEEVALNKELMVLAPNREMYKALDERGLLIGLFARDEGRLVGYSVTIMSPSHLHYQDLVTASNDVIYVDPAYRGSARLGVKMIRMTENLAKARGARMVLWHAKQNTPLERLLQAMAYSVQDIMLSRAV